MCGIAGVLEWDRRPDATVLARMLGQLSHRGPDADGLFSRPSIALGHRRLSVIDVGPESNQPLGDVDDRVWLTFNGEIYNYRELRAELRGLGARFRTAGDAEVILEAYKAWGSACVEHLNGMFAFALWDGPQQRLVLARDRTGEKPLYYRTLPENGLVFASELNALLEHPGVSSEISPRALGHYLSLNYTLGSDCILAGVQKLAPAHVLVAGREGAPRLSRYWDLAAFYREKSGLRDEREAAESLRALIDDAVRARLVSDVPLGAFLSGGLDSSSVVASMSQPGSGQRVETFSAGFREDTFSELPEARFAARCLGSRHRELVVEPGASRRLDTIVTLGGEPFADTSAVPVYFLAEFARRHVTVCLAGDGADEILAGYETYAADRVYALTRFAPAGATRFMAGALSRLAPVRMSKVGWTEKLTRYLAGHGRTPLEAHASWREIFAPEDKRRLLRPEWATLAGADPVESWRPFMAEVEGCDLIDQASYLDVKTWLSDDILVKLDRFTMAHALEARTPFLDHRLVEFAARLPCAWKLRGLRGKHLLRQSQRERLPASIRRRRKRGFNAPVARWLLSTLAPTWQRVREGPYLREWFATDEMERLTNEHLSKRADHGLKLYGLLVLGLWIEQLRTRRVAGIGQVSAPIAVGTASARA